MSGAVRSNLRKSRIQDTPYTRPTAKPKPLKKQSSWGMSTFWNLFGLIGLQDGKKQDEEMDEDPQDFHQGHREENPDDSELEIQDALLPPRQMSEGLQHASPSGTRVAQFQFASPRATAPEPLLTHSSPKRSPKGAREQVADLLRKKGQHDTPFSVIEIEGIISLLDKSFEGSNTSDSLRSSTARAREQVADLLRKKGRDGTSISEIEIEGIISLLNKSSEEPFRFSTAPATPPRTPGSNSQSPICQPDRIFYTSSLPSLSNKVASTPSGTPKKQLSRNPNGGYRWIGGGSARTTNSPSRRNTPQNRNSSSDGKRRKVDSSNDSPVLQFSSSDAAKPSAAEDSINGSLRSDAMNNVTPQRIPRPVLRPKTVPAHPSPLRQVVNGASPPGSPPSARGLPFPQKTPSRAVAVFNDIIEKATPPPKPDVSNPYQTASPVKPLAKVKERRRMTDLRAKEAERAKEKEVQKKQEDLSPKAIIEATVPKGAKRSRPPPNMMKSTATKSLSPESRLFGPRDDGDSMEVEEPKDADEIVAPTKRRRTVEVEEVGEDEQMNVSSDKCEVFEPTDGFLKPSQPAPPNTVPQSSNQLTGATSTPSASSNVFGSGAKTFAKSSLPTQPSKLRASFTAVEDDASEEMKATTSKGNASKVNGITPKEFALKKDIKALPTYVFRVTTTVIDPKYVNAAATAKARQHSALPAFDLTKAAQSKSGLSKPSKPAPPVFASAAAAQKSTDAWTCSLCMLKNPASVTDKCTVCETPRSSPSASASSVPTTSTSSGSSAFNTAAAAQKSTDAWTCSLCMLKNPASATDKCTICEAPRP